jgi:hypothetical protein
MLTQESAERVLDARARNIVANKPMARMSNNEALVFARTRAINPDGTYRPFSIYLRSKLEHSTQVTVLGVIMPDRDDLEGIPVLRTIPASAYQEILDGRQVESI